MTVYIPEREDVHRARLGATVAIAHDYLTQRGGAERVVLSIAKAFPGAMIHTSLFEPSETFPEFADLPIRTTALDHIDPLRHNHRVALPLLARSFSRMKVAADVVVCSSSGWAHGVSTEGRKVIYCHNPARWLYQSDTYRPAGTDIASVTLAILQRSLRRWDNRAAQGAHRYLANSTIVRDRIRDAYGLDAEVLPPPVTLDVTGDRRAIPGLDAGFVLCVSRLISYKNVDAVVAAMHGMPLHRLVIAGSGPDFEALQASAPPNVSLLGVVNDDQLRWLYANCAGVVSASYEDFGLVPIEAASFGKPAALLRWGGFLDTLAEGTSGVFFDEPTPVAVGEAVQRLLHEEWSAPDICEHAEQFSETRFIQRMQDIAREEAALAGSGPIVSMPKDRAATTDALPPMPLIPAPHRANHGAPVVTALRGFATKAAVSIADLAAVSLAMILSFVLWSWWRTNDPESYRSAHLWLGLLSLPVWLICLAQAGLYRSRIVTSRMEEMRRLARAATISVIGIASVSAVTRFEAARLWLALTFVLGLGLLTLERSITRSLFRRQRLRGRRLRGIVIIGTNDEAVDLALLLHNDKALGYRVRGFLSDDLPAGRVIAGLGSVLGRIDETLSAVRRTNSTGVLIATTAVNHDASTKLVSELSNVGVHVELSSSLRDVAIRRMTVRPVGRYPIVYVEPTTRSGWQGTAKRAFDIVVSVIGLVLVCPLLAIAAILIKIDSDGPVLFRQRRVGRGGLPFEVLKLRTMVPDAEQKLAELIDRNEASWPLFKMRRDPRVTRVGGILRRSSIDELPQLWNVLRGRMSIVGPRPALANEMTHWTPEMHARLRVRPGITGMWQVNGRSTSTAEDNERLDLYYIDNWSLLTDLAIIARTVPAVIATKGAY